MMPFNKGLFAQITFTTNPSKIRKTITFLDATSSNLYVRLGYILIIIIDYALHK